MHPLEGGGQSRLSRVARTSAGLWGSAALAFVGTVIAARALGPSEYGVVALALATAALVSTLLDLTLEHGIVHHGFKLLEAGDLGGLRGLLRAAIGLDLAIGVAITATMVALAAPIADVAGSGTLDAVIIQLAALTVLGGTIDGTANAVLLLAGRPELRAYAFAGTNLARLVSLLVAIAFFGTPEAVVLSYAVGTAVGGACLAVLAYRVGWRRWQAPDRHVSLRDSLGKLLPFAFHSSLATTILGANESILLLVLGSVAGASAVGLFKVAMLPVVLASLALGPVRLVMFAEHGRIAAAGRIEELRRGMVKWTLVSIAIAAPAAVVGVLILPSLIPALYGDPFRAAASAAQILVIAGFLFFAFPWTKTFPAVIGRPRVASALAVVMLLVALPTMVALSDEAEVGAAIGLSAGIAVMTAGYLVVARRYFRTHRRDDERNARAPGERLEPVRRAGALT